jgi:acyl-CoA thioesterase-1
VSFVLLLDGLHAGYEGGRPGPLESKLVTADLEPFVRFARDAAAGKKQLIVTHSEVFPGTFASTTETADYLLREVGVKRTAVLRWGPMGTQQLSEAGRGKLLVAGFAGNSAPDHVDHLHALPEFLAWVGDEAGGEAVRIVALGDSITRGTRPGVKDDETFAALLQAALRKERGRIDVTNAGVGGERTDGALQRLDRAVLAAKPRLVLVMYGTNDSYVDQGQKEPRLSAEQYRTNLNELVARLRKGGAEPILMTPPRWGNKATNGLGENPNVRLEEYVKVCREVARETKTPLVDHFAHWSKAASGGTDLGDWTTDQCHPNPRGHREIAELILPVVRDVLGKGRKAD